MTKNIKGTPWTMNEKHLCETSVPIKLRFCGDRKELSMRNAEFSGCISSERVVYYVSSVSFTYKVGTENIGIKISFILYCTLGQKHIKKAAVVYFLSEFTSPTALLTRH